MANTRMNSPEFAGLLHQYTQATVGMQHMFEKVVRTTLAKLDIPSRSDIAELTASLHRIEDKIDRLLPAEAGALASPRPARTRRPPQEASSAPMPPVDTSVKPAAKRAPRAAAKAPAQRARTRS